VTCYSFLLVSKAPKRPIVRTSIADAGVEDH
jgi:hypothetical protein